MATLNGRRFFRHGELPLVLLAVLSQKTLNGYEVLEELDRLFGPDYKPSPGAIYPALTALLEEGLITVADSTRRTYGLTRIGEKALRDRRLALSSIEVRTGVRLSDSDEFSSAVDRFVAQVTQMQGHVEPARLEKVLSQALDRLTASIEKRGANR